MGLISRRTHGVLDYVVGVFLIAAPRLFGFGRAGPASLVPVLLGLATLSYSLFTNYELGVFRLLSFRVHLKLDVLSGILMVISPWVFNFAQRVWVPHFLIGVTEIAVVVFTRAMDAEYETTPPGSPART